MAEPRQVASATNRRGNILDEIWGHLRPYTIRFIVDFSIAIQLWALLWIFKKAADWAPIDDWSGKFFLHIHSTGTVIAYGILVVLLLWDIIEIHKETRS